MRRLVLILALALGCVAPARAGSVAVTMDDLPIFGLNALPAEAEAITGKLLAGFRRHHWHVTGFVNEIQLEGPNRTERAGLLRRWLDAGMDLGNHSYSHFSLTKTSVEAYIADVARGETVTKALLAERGRTEHWYRHPYLETGPTLAIRRRFEGWLAAHGYRVAPVTMENSDWEFAEPYDHALARHDTAEAKHIRDAYLAYTTVIVPWYRKAASGLLGREPAFVLLIHASRLNAASIDALAAILRSNNLRPVSLDRAMTDPAYRIADDYAGPDGDEWVTRWATTLHRDLPYGSLPQVPDDIAKLDAGIEAAIPDPIAPISPPASAPHQ
jgi:peptidoglycan/xylan/chitin deacetylase (PgdA/CDA1 family)